MRVLKRRDTLEKIQLVDLHSKSMMARYPHIRRENALRYLHGELKDHGPVFGLDVTYHAWRLVGKKHWVAPLRWPVLKWFFDLGYRVFARYRHVIASLLVRCSRSSSGACHSSRKRDCP